MALDDIHLSKKVRRFLPQWLIDVPRMLVFVVKHWRVTSPRLSDNAVLRTIQRILSVLGLSGPWVLFSPERPIYRNVLRKMLALHACRATNDPAKSQSPLGVFKWHDTTFAPNDELVTRLSAERRVLNAGCFDISKKQIETVTAKVMGYSTAIDPAQHQGLAVEKSDNNSRHDGRVLNCPITTPPDPSKIYMKLINNEVGDGLVEDLRVPFVDGVIPYVYRKRRPVDTRFSNINAHVTVAETDQVFSPEEVACIANCCRALGLDYVEVDVLRDKSDGRIYLIDANWTPFGLPNHITTADEDNAAKKLSAAVAKMLRLDATPN